MQINKLLIFIFTVVLVACGTDDALPDTTAEEPTTEEPTEEPTEPTEEPTEEPTNPNAPNILLIIADDMGLDATAGYDVGSIKPQMPNLVQLMNEGIRFDNLWSNPECTPTRAGILTGKYGFRTGVREVGDVLSTSEISIQNHVETNANGVYANAVIGKWHLSNSLSHPIDMGVDYYAGHTGGGVSDYYDWELVEDGNVSAETTYITTKLTDLAIDWVDGQTQPWFLWLAYNAPHVPFHVPPADLHSQGALPINQATIDDQPLLYYLAAIEAMDTEMGRLINSMSQAERDNTIIIFIGDNGTPNPARQEYANRRVKGSVYQGGVNVPMVVSGKGVDRINSSEDALITVTDIFATVSDIVGGAADINDSKSFKGLFSGNDSRREFAYSEIGRDGGTADVAIRNQTHKYIQFEDGSERLYNLISDPFEVSNLLANGQAGLSTEDNLEFEKLTAELAKIQL